MEAKQFFEEVVKLRKLQKDYFKTRSSMALRASKKQEQLNKKLNHERNES